MAWVSRRIPWIGLTLVLSGCSRPHFVALEPAVIDTRPANVYMLLYPVSPSGALGRPVKDLGDGNISIGRWSRVVHEYRTVPFDELVGTHPVSGRLATFDPSGEESSGSPWALRDLDYSTGPPMDYEVESATLHEHLAPPPVDGPYVAAEVVGTATCVGGALTQRACVSSEGDVFAVIVDWQGTQAAAVTSPQSTAPPVK